MHGACRTNNVKETKKEVSRNVCGNPSDELNVGG